MFSMSSAKFSVLIYLVFNFLILISCKVDKPCILRKYNEKFQVCVCNNTYCDTISPPDPIAPGKYVLYSSSLSGTFFKKQFGSIHYKLKNEVTKPQNHCINWLKNLLHIRNGRSTFKIDRNKIFQTIVGFGGAFTDAFGMNLLTLSEKAQKKLIDSYFSKYGLEYNMGRVPIGGTDFSTHLYAYNMEPENDVSLSNFSLSREDYEYKIPVIQKAMKVVTSKLYLIGAVWSPPVWMKTNHAYCGFGFLHRSYYQTYADYHIKFLEEYDKSNITFWAISTGNEPALPIFHSNLPINSIGWFPADQATWLANNFGPLLRKSKFSKTLILAFDDTREHMLWYLILMSFNVEAVKYIDGIALHWYSDDKSPFYINVVQHFLPNTFIISTEACVGSVESEPSTVLGSWDRAEKYVKDIIENLNHGYVGWLDWNLALNKAGGPNFFGAYVDSPILILPENDEFLKQPMFYAMGHFSKFIPRGSKRISVEIEDDYIDSVAFLRPDNTIVVVFFNRLNDFVNITIRDDYKAGDMITDVEIALPPRSMHTLIYH